MEGRDEGVHAAAGRRVRVAEPRTDGTLAHRVRQRAQEAWPAPQRIATWPATITCTHSSSRFCL